LPGDSYTNFIICRETKEDVLLVMFLSPMVVPRNYLNSFRSHGKRIIPLTPCILMKEVNYSPHLLKLIDKVGREELKSFIFK